MNSVFLRVVEGDAEVLNVVYRTPLGGDALASGVLRLLYEGPEFHQELDMTLYEISESYRSLARYLDGRHEQSLVLSLEDIEEILGNPLPASASKHNAWWSNTDTHSQAKAWLKVGWKTRHVDLKSRNVVFYRIAVAKRSDPDMFHKPEPRQMTILSATQTKVTPNGNRYLECETSLGRVAVWGSTKNDSNIRALLTNTLPIEVIAMCIPGKHNHIYWIPETTSLFLAARSTGLTPTNPGAAPLPEGDLPF
ncbi:hypothetical protein [uncultured Deinococcus sp.]|uniref:DUF7662 domain-containing protein n=1 Tax=uncultured Deinococcus sp. TaxID=158789 RepID=UPI00258D447B|nr:hypothetical protein [uncultured Deinococcus sp.]